MSYSTIIQTPFLLLFLLFHSCTSMKSPHSDPDGEELSDDLLLWYEKPATDWMTEALPIGNGYIGTMFYGGIQKEVLQFSEGSLWSGGPGTGDQYNYGIRENAWTHLNKIRRSEERREGKERSSEMT